MINFMAISALVLLSDVSGIDYDQKFPGANGGAPISLVSDGCFFSNDFIVKNIPDNVKLMKDTRNLQEAIELFYKIKCQLWLLSYSTPDAPTALWYYQSVLLGSNIKIETDHIKLVLKELEKIAKNKSNFKDKKKKDLTVGKKENDLLINFLKYSLGHILMAIDDFNKVGMDLVSNSIYEIRMNEKSDEVKKNHWVW